MVNIRCFSTPSPQGRGWGRLVLSFHSNGLVSGDNDHLHNVLYLAAAAQVVDRSSYTLQDWTYCISTRETLYQLVADIARLQIWENKHIGFACYSRTWGFLFAYALHECSIQLQLAIECQIGCHLVRQTCGLYHFVHEFVFCTTFA